MTDIEIYEFICSKPDPRTFCRGLVTALPAMRIRRPDLAERVERIARDIVGETMWSQIMGDTVAAVDLNAVMGPKPHNRDHERRPIGR